MGRRAVVVDDERLPRSELCAMLEARGIEIVGEAKNVRSAIEVIEATAPDLLFLDIQLGRETAFDLLERTEITAEIVFVTAYDEYAVRAFEVNACDYLLKPVDPDRLAEALDRVRISSSEEGSEADAPLEAGDRLFLRVGKRWRFIALEQIRVIESDGDRTVLTLSDGGSVPHRSTMKGWESRLPGGSFLRIHRSTLVNLDHVTRVEEWFNRTFQVHVEGIEKPFTMSRRYASRIRDRR